MLKNKQRYLLCCRYLMYFIIICVILLAGCGDREDSSTTQDDIVQIPVSPITLTAEPNNITVGTSQNISFTADGGTGLFRWDMDFSDTNDADKFEFSGFGSQAVLSYNGGAINSKTIIILVEDGTGYFANTFITINNADNTLTLTTEPDSGSDKFSIGISKNISFTASGGTGSYLWGDFYSKGLSEDAFIFSNAGNSAILMYDGKDTVPGTISISIKDDLGRKAEKLIIVSGEGIGGVLSIEPSPVGIGGETLCIFELKDVVNNVPVPGKNISFQIEQGPAFFIDADGNEFEESSKTSGISDFDGFAYARIKTGYTEEGTNVIVSAVLDTGERYSKEFVIDRSHGTIEFQENDQSPWLLTSNGAIASRTQTWVINLSLVYKDMNEKPLYNRKIMIDTYLKTDNINEDIRLGDTPLPAFLTTDDDGVVDFILKLNVEYTDIPPNFQGRIGSLVISGVEYIEGEDEIEEENNIRGTYAIGFDVDTSVKETATEP